MQRTAVSGILTSLMLLYASLPPFCGKTNIVGRLVTKSGVHVLGFMVRSIENSDSYIEHLKNIKSTASPGHVDINFANVACVIQIQWLTAASSK